MPICVIDPIGNPYWQSLIQTHPFANLFHSPQWFRSLEATYQFEIKAVIKLDDSGQALAGIPFCIFDDARGKRIVSMPFSDFSDPLVQSIEEWHELLEPLLAENCPIIIRPLHNSIPLLDSNFIREKCAKWHGIDLQAELETLWSGLHESARRAIRKSQRLGIRIRIANHDELRSFFELHLKVRKYKYRLLAQPYAFFENIWENLVEAKQGLVFLAEYEGRIIGSLFFLSYGDVFTYKFSATNQDELEYRPTDMLLWEAMQYGKAEGYKLLDLGLSDWEQEGLLRFKRKYASEEKTISFLRYTPPNYQAPENRFGATLAHLTELFTRADVPDLVTEEAGDLLYQFFT